MKNIRWMMVILILGSALAGQGQTTEEPPICMDFQTVAAMADALDHNYLVRLQIVNSGTNRTEFKWVTAKRSFHLKTVQPNLTLLGRIAIPKSGTAYVEYDLACTDRSCQALDPKSSPSLTGTPSVNTGLFSMMSESWPHARPPWKEASDSKPWDAPRPFHLSSGVLLNLGQEIILLQREQEIFTLRIDRLTESNHLVVKQGK